MPLGQCQFEKRMKYIMLLFLLIVDLQRNIFNNHSELIVRAFPIGENKNQLYNFLTSLAANSLFFQVR
jgi:hypothetical protein